MATAIGSNSTNSTPSLLTKANVPSWETSPVVLRLILKNVLFDFKPLPEKLEQSINLAERAKKWQDLPKEKTIYVLKCIATALLTVYFVGTAIFLFQYSAFSLLFCLPALIPPAVLFDDSPNVIHSDVFYIRPDWESLDRERRTLLQTYGSQMRHHISVLTTKIQEVDQLYFAPEHAAVLREARLKDLKLARDVLQNVWNWIEGYLSFGNGPDARTLYITD